MLQQQAVYRRFWNVRFGHVLKSTSLSRLYFLKYQSQSTIDSCESCFDIS
jgi:hypothetical protein